MKTSSTMWAVICSVLLASLVLPPAVANSTSLLERVDALEDTVDSLHEKVETIDQELHHVVEQQSTSAKEQVELDFEIVGLERGHDTATSTFYFTVRYNGVVPTRVLGAPDHNTVPRELGHRNNAIQLTVPDTYMSPYLYILSHTGLQYTLSLISPSGPLSVSKNISNIAISTSPPLALPYSGDGNTEQEVTLTSHVVGNRRVREETVTCYTYVTDLQTVILSQFEMGSEGGETGSVRLVEKVTPDNTTTVYRMKLNPTSPENRGVLVVKHSFVFDCTGGCILYETVVSHSLPYYRDDLYDLKQDAWVPSAPNHLDPYVGVIGYSASDNVFYTTETCDRGQSCSLFCTAFGDHPQAFFNASGTAIEHVPYFTSDRYVVVETLTSASSWTAHMGPVTATQLRWDSVSETDEGRYVCYVQNGPDTEVFMRKVIELSVV